MAKQAIQPVKEATRARAVVSVFSDVRDLQAPPINGLKLRLNTRLKMDGLALLKKIPPATAPAAFFDPQYRGILDKMNYGNEGRNRGKARSELKQMDEATIGRFIAGIDRALIPSGHLFLWMDKFHFCTDFTVWLEGTDLNVVDLLTWHKERMGMGYRTRRTCEYLIVLQKLPKRAKGVWTLHNIPDMWSEKAGKGTHAKPIDLQGKLIAATTKPGDLVIDPAAGSFSVLEACKIQERNFLGCDLNGHG